VVLALAAGVLGQAGRISLHAAASQALAGARPARRWWLAPGRLPPGTAAAVLAAAAITVMAVQVVG